ncbi:MAG: T9SS type A sorting domain-containing protein [Saprospiraceae bacterium]
MRFIFKNLSFYFSLLLAIWNLSIAAQPSNDDPCGATELSIENTGVCVPSTPLSWTDATATLDFPAPACASYLTGDVWFKFTLTAPGDIFITTLPGTGLNAIADGGMELYYADSGCNSLFYRLNCNDDSGPGAMPQIALPAQAAGTYYIRLWDNDHKTSANIGGLCVASSPVSADTPNDDPCNAIELTVMNGDTCIPNNPFVWLNATATPGLSVPDCGSYKTGDIWFSFTLTDTSDIFISTTAGMGTNAITDGALSIYADNGCDGTMTELRCQDDRAGGGTMPELIDHARLPGHYFIRFWDYLDKVSGNIGGICVSAQPSVYVPVLNDDPCGALELTVVSDTSCIPDNPQSWVNATGTTGITGSPCGSDITADVWFKFSVTEASDIFITTSAGTGAGAITDGIMALYSSSTCFNNLYFLFCDDDSGPGRMPQIHQYALPVGEYYIRFWDSSLNISGNIGGVCVASKPTISMVPNDNCFSALPFPILPADGSCSTVSVNTENATGSSDVVCGGIADDDVWYSFIVPAGVTQISYSITHDGQPSAQVMRLRKGNCDVQTNVGCYYSADGIIGGLNSGSQYYIRTFSVGADTSAQFDICLRAAYPPINDDPCGAITLIPEENVQGCMSSTPLSWQYATDSEAAGKPGCGSYSTGDVWYKFELTYKADVVITSFAGTGSDAIVDGAMAVYKQGEDCNDLISLGCNDDASTEELMPALSDFAVSPGIYFIRFWDYYASVSGNIGGICIAINPTISTEENDQCDGALPFPIIPVDGSCSVVHVNTAGATGGGNASLPGHNDDDLWYSFVVPPGVNTLLYDITTISGNIQHALCVYDGCEGGIKLNCFLAESGRIDQLIAGNTYFIQVYTPEANATSEFNLCLKMPPPAPSNDECTGAISFPVIPKDGSCVPVSMNTTWATSSEVFSCDGVQNDVWYTFVMPVGADVLFAEFISTGNPFEIGFELFSGQCGQLLSIGCYGGHYHQSLRLDDLTPGQTYFLRAYTSDSRLFEFGLCLKSPGVVPVNDLCKDAIPFPEIPVDGSCATMIANTKGATGDYSTPCYDVIDDDVWFSFVIPLGYTRLIVSTTTLSGDDATGTVLYGGDCDHPEFLGCQLFSESVFSGLVGGETYYLSASTLFRDVEATFEICIALPPPPPSNDNCADAIPFPVIPENGDWSRVDGTTFSATNSGPPGCNGYPDDDVWYSFVVPVGGERLLFRRTDYNSLVYQLFDGDCDSLNMVDCFGTTNGRGAFYNLIEGNIYYLRVYDSDAYGHSDFTLELSVPQVPLNDFCFDAIAFPPIPTDGTCVSLSGNTVWATDSGIQGCGNDINRDVWYEFTVPDGYTAVIIDNTVDFGDGFEIQLFGGSCDALFTQECLQLSGRDDLSGLEPGGTYWIQVLPEGTSAFTLCLSVPPPPPENDNCNKALLITSNAGVFSDPGIQTTAGATDSGYPICFLYDGSTATKTYDVWYQFVTDQDGGDATVWIDFTEQDLNGYLFSNFNIQAYEGTCEDFSTLACLTNENYSYGANDTSIVLNLYGLLPNTTYYFRVFPTSSSGNYVPVDFKIFASGSALNPTTGTVDAKDKITENLLHITSIYPSPASTKVTVLCSTRQSELAEIYVSDILGHSILKKEFAMKQGDNNIDIVTDAFPAGLYVVSIASRNGQVASKRFIKQ